MTKVKVCLSTFGDSCSDPLVIRNKQELHTCTHTTHAELLYVIKELLVCYRQLWQSSRQKRTIKIKHAIYSCNKSGWREWREMKCTGALYYLWSPVIYWPRLWGRISQAVWSCWIQWAHMEILPLEFSSSRGEWCTLTNHCSTSHCS